MYYHLIKSKGDFILYKDYGFHRVDVLIDDCRYSLMLTHNKDGSENEDLMMRVPELVDVEFDGIEELDAFDLDWTVLRDILTDEIKKMFGNGVS